MKERLLKLLKAKNERKAAISSQADKSTDVVELRGLNTELEALNTEIRSLQEMVDELKDDKADDTYNERTAAVNGDIPGVVISSANSQEQRKNKDTENLEYRNAFKDFVTKGTEIPQELRADATTKTTDIGNAIPSIVVNRIIEKVESLGMILPLVTRTSFAAGVNIPLSSVKPVATWVAEGAKSDRQKKSTSGVITFTHHKLRCEISLTMESGVMAIAAFENAFVKQVSEAMVKAIEISIISGVGTSSPKGVLTETPVADQLLSVEAPSYQVLVDAEAALPQAYEGNAVWCMTKKTFMSFIGMVDKQDQPIARINYGIGGKPERTLLGRTVVLCGDYIDSYSTTLAAGSIFAFIFDFSDYTLNTVYDMGIQRKQDWDTEDYLTKAVMAVDGKVTDKNSLVVLKKKAA